MDSKFLKYKKKSNSVENDLTNFKNKSSPESEYSLRFSDGRNVSPSPPNSSVDFESVRITAKAIPPKTPGGRKKASSFSLVPQDGVTVSIQVMMQCLSRAVWYEIRANEYNFGTHVDVFCEESHSFIPSMKTIESFFSCIFNTKSLSIECAVTAVAYVDKLGKISSVKLNRLNWKRICFISVLEADKVLRDKLVWNEDYKDIIVGIDLETLRKLERAFLKYIEFSLTLTQSEYAAYLIDLLSLRNHKDPPTPERIRHRTGSQVVEFKRSSEDELIELNRSI
jgi:hypothetical protein